ncbi:MAG: hypothetical protein ACTTIO_00310 [Candidatus Fimenecus sp.]
MKKKLLTIVFCALFLFNINAFSFASNTNRNKSFYKVDTTSLEWKNLDTTEKLRKAVYIDEKELNPLSTDEILRAVLEYPLIGDIFAFNSTKEGIEYVSTHCTALRLLLNRADAHLIVKKAENNNSETIKRLKTKDSITIELAPFVLEELNNYFLSNMDELNRAVVYTPKGTSVQVQSLSEMSQAMINAQNSYFINRYPQAYFVSTSTRKYNCHSYAWYSSSTSNIYWMNNPNAYMSDGSYNRVYNIGVASKVYYSSANHSAIVNDVVGNAICNATVKSKWGKGPLMEHKTYYGPYGGTVTLWA